MDLGSRNSILFANTEHRVIINLLPKYFIYYNIYLYAKY